MCTAEQTSTLAGFACVLRCAAWPRSLQGQGPVGAPLKGTLCTAKARLPVRFCVIACEYRVPRCVCPGDAPAMRRPAPAARPRVPVRPRGRSHTPTDLRTRDSSEKIAFHL